MISVLIPTYKRLPFLKRAIEDVFAQTFKDWELIITDDEVGPGESWGWLKSLAKKDARIKIIKNLGPKHGQVFNVNNGLRHCRGEWIKVLFDDDRMLPNCLERMLRVAERVPSAAMIGCRAQKWRNGVYAGDEKNFAKGTADIIASNDCREAILLFDRWNGRTPTHMLINRSSVTEKSLMPEHVSYKIPVDWVWFAAILDSGDYVMMSDTLVCQCEGEVCSITGDARKNECTLDREMFLAYKDIYDGLSDEKKNRLSFEAINSELNGIRGIYHLKCRHVYIGLKKIMKSFKSFRGMMFTLRWVMQELLPSRFSVTKRRTINV